MQELLGKIGRFCESHVEKLVLVVVCLVCAYLFFTRVIFSPYVVEYDGKTFSPGQIDKYIEAKAQDLQNPSVANSGGGQERAYTSKVTGPIDPNHPIVADVFLGRPKPQSFTELLNSPLAFMASNVVPDLVEPQRDRERPRYRLPRVGPVTDVGINHIRAAAWMPLAELTPETTYDSVEVEPNDIDLVTVEAKFDTAELYRQFRAYFNGTEVERQAWRDPCLAEPTFAAVQLQRQRRLDDGRWSDWSEVPRSRVEANRELFSVIERVEDLPPGGLKIRLMHFDNDVITMSLLQPESYQIASAEEEWFPPSFYDKFKDLQRKVEAEERKKEREEAQRSRPDTTGRRRDTTRSGTTGGTTGGQRGRRRDTAGGMGMGGAAYGGGQDMTRTRGGRGRSRPGQMMDPTMPGGATQRRGRTRRSPMDQGYGDMGAAYGGMMPDAGMRLAPSTDEAYFEFSQAMINYTTDLSKEKEPVLFWALDDTAEPGGTYRYRIRLGVFNPVAGTDKLDDRDMDKKDQVILWSDFSTITDAVAIPKRLYFFAKDVQEKTKTATVEVARFALGYWRTEDFRVQPGEVIGEEKEPEPEEERDRRSARLAGGRITGAPMGRDMMMQPGYGAYGPGAGMYGPGAGMYQTPTPQDETMPDIIDYRTHTVLVDLVTVNDWGPNLQPRMYHDMLYTADGVNIEHMPVNTRNWPRNLLEAYQDIAAKKRRDPEPFRDFSKGGMRGRRGPGGGGMDPMNPYGGEMMYDMPGGAYPGYR
ncbi:MAG: hypothetical protein ACYTAS_08375 [Planctomycetota bacterium]|jgi:hypothetical protein